jgi:hypothetical protein
MDTLPDSSHPTAPPAGTQPHPPHPDGVPAPASAGGKHADHGIPPGIHEADATGFPTDDRHETEKAATADEPSRSP